MSNLPLDPLMQKLADRGLYIRRAPSPSTWFEDSYVMARSMKIVDPEFGIMHMAEQTRSWLIGSQWSFNYRNAMPGPGLDCFEQPFDRFDQLVDAVERFYFGEPTIIEGWVVPLHRHPELELSAVQLAISQARPMDGKTFLALVDQNFKDREPFFGTPLFYQKSLQAMFLPILHKTDSTRQLCLRRDVAEAYIIPIGFYPPSNW